MNNIMNLMAARHDFYAQNPGLGATDLHMLEHLAICENAGLPLTVTEAMRIYIVASPATNHRILDKLIEHDLLQQKHENGDFRSKYLYLTRKGRAYFSKLERLIGRMK